MENTPLDIPDPEELAATRAQLTTPMARAKRMILDKILVNVVRAIENANNKDGACLLHVSTSAVYPTYAALSHMEQALVLSLFPPVKKLDTHTANNYLSKIVRAGEAIAYIRAKLVAKSPMYRVKGYTNDKGLSVSWAR